MMIGNISDKVVAKMGDNIRQLFLIDGIGALLSAFLLGFVLVKLEHVFGIPPTVLYILASVPILFLLFDVGCYFLPPEKIGTYLKAIGVANFFYCCLSLALVINHIEEITVLGWTYILVEIALVATIGLVELEVGTRLCRYNNS